jgi:hypothetical protein
MAQAKTENRDYKKAVNARIITEAIMHAYVYRR